MPTRFGGGEDRATTNLIGYRFCSRNPDRRSVFSTQGPLGGSELVLFLIFDRLLAGYCDLVLLRSVYKEVKV